MSQWSRSLSIGAFPFALLASSCETKSTYVPDDAGTDASVQDAGGDATTIGDAGNTCSPGAITGFTPSWTPPTKFHQGKCVDKQIRELVACYFDAPGKPSNCPEILKEQDCTACLFTSSVLAQAGPLVIEGKSARLNVPGCIATFEGDVSDKSCGAKYKAAADCALAACADNCPGEDAAAVAARTACAKQSLTTVCKSFADAAACSDDLLASDGKAAACAAGNDFVESAVVLGKLFCGQSATDAGAPDGN